MAWDIVIAGGGFGGLYAARRLETVLPKGSARVQIIAQENYLLYTPLLPGAAAGTLEPRHVVVPLRESLKSTELRLGRITGADPDRSEIHLVSVDGREESVHYDQLIVAVGSVSRVLPIPGLAEHGMGFKTISEAIALRNRALQNLEVAESLDRYEDRRAYLTFIFVGAGYAGLEGIAELQDYVADVIERYPRCRIDGARCDPGREARSRDAGDQRRPGRLRDARACAHAGSRFAPARQLDSVDEVSATLSTGERMPARTRVLDRRSQAAQGGRGARPRGR